MTRKVLIVSPHFPPISAPDHQRIRMSLPYFREFGWEAYVLAVSPEYVEGTRDCLLAETMPGNLKVTRTPAFPVSRTSKFGMRSLSLRCLPYLHCAGKKIIERDTIDLVYFSTTMFPVMSLGAYWREQLGVPYVLDFQDPWLSDYYSRPNAPTPPGGRLKYQFSQTIARILEPYALRKCSHVISVSPMYPQVLLKRYPWLRDNQFTVLPFGGAERDFAHLCSLESKQDVFDPNDGLKHWVYVGRGGKDMTFALRGLFLAVKADRDRKPKKWDSIRLHFIGTDYASGSRAVGTVEPLARELGVGDLVEERVHRIGYFEALRVLVESNAIILIGSDDPGYTASKLFPCILAKKPILAIFHEQSSVVDILRRCNAGRAVTFGASENPTDLVGRISTELEWLHCIARDYVPETNWSEFQPYTAREMTRKQCAVFDNCLGRSAGV